LWRETRLATAFQRNPGGCQQPPTARARSSPTARGLAAPWIAPGLSFEAITFNAIRGDASYLSDAPPGVDSRSSGEAGQG
jgi:hypothetical protein